MAARKVIGGLVPPRRDQAVPLVGLIRKRKLPAAPHALRLAAAARPVGFAAAAPSLRFAAPAHALALLRLRPRLGLIELVGIMRTTFLIRNTVLFAHSAPSDEYKRTCKAGAHFP